MLSLGEFNNLAGDGEQGMESFLVILFFLAATFQTQVTMLNMLIAIMGDSFDRSMESKEHYSSLMKFSTLYNHSANLS